MHVVPPLTFCEIVQLKKVRTISYMSAVRKTEIT